MTSPSFARRLRHHAGALVHDWPRFLRAMAAGRGGWVRFHNRDERLTIDPGSGGAWCEWRFSSDLHLCKLSPLASRALLRRALRDRPIAFAADRATSDAPRVSYVIGHRGEDRLPLLLATLATIAAQRDAAIECIVVEQSARALLPPHLPSWVRHLHTPVASDDAPYNRSAALNAGAEAARGSLLVLHDNDLLLPADHARAIVALHDAGWEMIDAKRFVFYFDRHATEIVTSERRIPFERSSEKVSQNFLAGGSIAADREAYFAIGGFDEAFVGWGGEDNDFWERASTRRAWAFGFLPIVHLWHAPQREKVGSVAEGVKRYHARTNIPAAERIAELLARRKRSG
ncbi:MAG TPA: galactosyltransferase-related protein [Thermoanaerobaculia bacterium]|nr:galactosyltransferase-related protein [Thermoanaerobaculia bacterium]